jgi:hypothetical protein
MIHSQNATEEAKEAVPDMTWFSLNRIRLLNPTQRGLVHSLMKEFAECESSAYLRAAAARAAALIDSVK